MTKALAPHQYLPPEVQMDEYHPANQQFFKDLKALERALVDISQQLGHRHTQIVKMRHKGMRPTDIAEEIGVTATTVSVVTKKPLAQRMLALLEHLSQHRDGPNIDQRKRTLWEIVVDNQETDPKTAIAALQEMNKMDGVGKDRVDSKIEVTINQNLMPRGALDD